MVAQFTGVAQCADVRSRLALYRHRLLRLSWGLEVQMQLSVRDVAIEALQRLAVTGTGEAQAGERVEHRTVRGALDECAIHVEELILLPVQLHAEMRAAVAVDPQFAIEFQCEHALAVDLEALGGAFIKIIDGDEGNGGG